MRQEKTPLFEAVKQYVASGTIPFHVPGHKQGQGLPELRDYVGRPSTDGSHLPARP